MSQNSLTLSLRRCNVLTRAYVNTACRHEQLFTQLLVSTICKLPRGHSSARQLESAFRSRCARALATTNEPMQSSTWRLLFTSRCCSYGRCCKTNLVAHLSGRLCGARAPALHVRCPSGRDARTFYSWPQVVWLACCYRPSEGRIISSLRATEWTSS